MIAADNIYDTTTSMENLGSMLRIIADFDSYQTQASSRLPWEFDTRHKQYTKQREDQKKQRVRNVERARETVKASVRAQSINSPTDFVNKYRSTYKLQSAHTKNG